MTDRGAESPSPFSREGSRPSDALGADPAPDTPGVPGPTEPNGSTGSSASPSAAQIWQAYPSSSPPDAPFTPPAADPYAVPQVDPGFDPQPTPPYVSYGDSRPYDLTPPAAYGTNPYEVAPYQPGYGGYSPYGMVAIQHPRAVPAMVLGIVGIVLAASCGVGGFLGIGGIVLGRKARNEIDTEPGRYAGRSQAVAGIVTGTIGTVLGALITILVIVVIAVGAGLEGF
jgi:hypothetical protein